MLYLFPDLVRKSKIYKYKLSPDYLSSKTISYEKNIKKTWLTNELSKNGIIGDPTNASAIKGEKIVDKVVIFLKKIVNEMYN